MNYQSLFSSVAKRPVRAGVVGVGEFGVSLAARDRRLDHLNVSALADIHVDRACERLVRAGLARDELAICETVDQALAALETGKRVIASDASILPKLPLDVLVDATGDPETAARTADDGIRQRQAHRMASKEADSVVGPMLYRKARAAGLVYTPVDGDQPSLLIKLVSWARELGLEVIAAGKASEYDFVYEPAADTVSTRTNPCASRKCKNFGICPRRAMRKRSRCGQSCSRACRRNPRPTSARWESSPTPPD